MIFIEPNVWRIITLFVLIVIASETAKMIIFIAKFEIEILYNFNSTRIDVGIWLIENVLIWAILGTPNRSSEWAPSREHASHQNRIDFRSFRAC